ncbi:MAG: AMP-binding protein [Marmoricola sp.]
MDAELFAEPNIVGTTRPDGSVLLRSADALADHPTTVLESFRAWSAKDPEHVLARQRVADGCWRTLTYGEADRLSRSLGQALLDRGLGPDRPLMVLSGNSLDHLAVVLGAMAAGVPVSPVSVAYSLQSRAHARIKEIASLLTPGAVYVDDAGAFAGALDALPEVPAIVGRGERAGAAPLADLTSTPAGAEVDAAFAALGPESVAKILFTSGSTGSPKGVVTTHGMLAANQQMMRRAWPFLTTQRPVIVDWLPWSHTFGGSHNLGLILVSGGTLYIDDGRPTPALFGETVRNLTEVPPTIYFNVPAGYAQLVPMLESDEAFAARFFSELRLLFNAAAALPDGLRNRLQAVAVRTAVTRFRSPVRGGSPRPPGP